MSELDDLLAGAKSTLGSSNAMAQSIGSDQSSYPRAAAVRQQHPGVYDDLTDEQIEAGLAKKDVQAAPPDAWGTVKNFLSGAASTSPWNPMNTVRALAHPIDTVSSMISTPLKNAASAVGDLRDVVTGGENNDRLLAAAKFGQDTLGAIPLVGDTMKHAGNQIGEGNIAEGTGELAGLASGLLLPKAAGPVGRKMQQVGSVAEELGGNMPDFKTMAQAMGPASVVTAGLGHPLAAAAELAAPPLIGAGLRGGGRLAQRVGSVVEGLGSKAAPLPDLPDTEIPLTGPGYGRYQPGPANSTWEASGPGSNAPKATPEPDLAAARANLPSEFRTQEEATAPGPTPAYRPGPRDPLSYEYEQHQQANVENIQRNAPYGEGGIMPGPKPTELLDSALEGLGYENPNQMYSFDAGAVIPRSIPEFTYEAGQADVPGLSVDSPGAFDLREPPFRAGAMPEGPESQGSLFAERPPMGFPTRPFTVEPQAPTGPSGQMGFEEPMNIETGDRPFTQMGGYEPPAPTAPPTPEPPPIPKPKSAKPPKKQPAQVEVRGQNQDVLDQLFEKAAREKGSQGAPLKGESGYVSRQDPGSHLYDPQTDTAYIRQQLQTATDPAEIEFLRRSLDQRNQQSLAMILKGLAVPQ